MDHETDENRHGATPMPREPGEISYLVVRQSAPDDMLSGVDLYFRANKHGTLIVFGRDSISLGQYRRGDWLSISPVFP